MDPEDVSLTKLKKLNESAERELEELERKLKLAHPKPENTEDNNTNTDTEEPDTPVPVPVLPRTPILVGGNAQRLEEAVEELEQSA